jgi:trimeric autotransporter adhesin
MSAQVTILQLPAAGAITGAEAVPIVQNGVTVQTTTAAIAATPTQTYTYLTVTQTPQLPNSRYFGATNGLTLSDGGAQGVFNISTTGALLSLVNSGTGFQVKTSSTAITGRSIAVSGAGLSIADGDGIAGNPTITLAGQVLALANLSANGLMTITSAGTLSATQINGVSNQTEVFNADGTTGYPTVGLASNPTVPGTGAILIPVGTTGQRPAGVAGKIRYNSTDNAYEGYSAGSWRQFSLSGGVTLVDTGTGLTGGPITGTGTISIANTAVTAGSYGSATQVGTFTVNAQGQLTAAANATITPAGIGAVSSVSGTANEITATGTTTVVVSLPTALTFTGKTVTGGTFNATAVTVGGVDVVTLTGTQTLTNKTLTLPVISQISNSGVLTLPTSTDTLVGRATTDTLTNKSISGATNTLSNIANASLTNSSVTVGTTAIALGASSLTLGGLTSVAVTQDPTTALQLATKQYVDTLAASGIHYHDPVYVESPNTAGNLNATYNQPGGAGDGVGATLTNAGAQVALTIDGVLTTVGMRVLIYNQTNAVQNGVYTVTTVGSGSTNWVLTRATDADTYSPFSPDALGQGDAFFVQAGATGAGETYICNTVGTIVFGTTNITFAQISSAQVYSAGTGLTLTGTVFSITNTAVTANTYGSASAVPVFAVNAQGQITGVTDTNIAIAASQVTSGTLAVAQGGTNIASYTIGDMLYASGGTTLSKLALGTQGYVLTAGATGPEWSGISGGTF